MNKDEWVAEINRLLAIEHDGGFLSPEDRGDLKGRLIPLRITSVKPIGREPTTLKTISDGIELVNRTYLKRNSVEL